MKKINLLLLAIYISFSIKWVSAADDAGILWWVGIWWSGEQCVTWVQLRNWDIHLEDIPCMLKWMIDIFMWFAATIAVIFIIIWAYQILYGSIEWNKTKGKETIMMALGGFALAAFSWVIVKFILNNFS